MDLTALTNAIPSVIASLAMGALTCFLGYRLRKVWIALAGLVFGFAIGSSVAAQFTDQGTAALIGLGVGLVLMLLCVWLYNTGIFILCGGCAVAICYTVIAQFSLAWYLQLAIVAAVFVVAGILAMHFVKPVLIVVTAFSGAGSIVTSLAGLGIPYITAGGTAGTVCVLLFAIAGIVVQFSTAKGK